MVAGGYNSEGLLNDVELISNSVNENCSRAVNPMKDGPDGEDFSAQGLTGQFTKNAAIVCGGKNDDEPLKDCYEYDTIINSWKKIPSTINSRYEAASVLDKDENFWILGGGTNDPKGFDSSEIYVYKPKGKGIWKKGKPLPPELRDTGITSHCAVRINTTHTFLAGGFAYTADVYDPLTDRERAQSVSTPSTVDLKEAGAVPRRGQNKESRKKRQEEGETIEFQRAWLYDGFYWEEVADMFETRDRAACTLFLNSNIELRVLVAGGCEGGCQNSNNNALTSVEMYNPDSDEWTKVAPLPIPLHSAKMDLLEGIPTIIGGYNAETKTQNEAIYQYFNDDDEWREHPTLKMRVPRSSAAVFQVPRSMFPECLTN